MKLGRIILLMLVLTVVASACSDDAPTSTNKKWDWYVCDTCENELLPPSVIDFTPRVPSVCWQSSGVISHDGKYIAFEAGNSDWYSYPERQVPITGLVVMDMHTRDVVYFREGFYLDWRWAPKHNRLFFIDAMDGTIHSLDEENWSTIGYPELGVYEHLQVSPTGRYLYANGYRPGITSYGLFKWDIETDRLEYITGIPEMHGRFMVKNDSIIYNIASLKDSLYTFNTITNTLESKNVAMPFDWLNMGSERDISPDGTMIVLDPAGNLKKTGNYYDVGVWILDVHSLDLRQVIPRHPYYPFDRETPRWGKKNTIIARWFCRKDSTELLYEFGLDGSMIRAVTTRKMKYWN